MDNELMFKLMKDFENKKINMKATDFILLALTYSAYCFHDKTMTVKDQLEFIANIGDLLNIATDEHNAQKTLALAKKAYDYAVKKSTKERDEIKEQLKEIRDAFDKAINE